MRPKFTAPTPTLFGIAAQPAASAEPAAYDIRAFCRWHNICRGTFFKMQREGRGPRTYKVGSKVYVSREAARDWRENLEGLRAAEQRNKSAGAKELGAPKDRYNDAQKMQLRESYINLGMSEADADASAESLMSASTQ